MHLTSHITHSNGYAPYITYYRSNGFDQRFRKLKPKPKLNPPNAHRSHIKICEKIQTQNVQFRFMPNAFRILKPIQKRVWVFRNTGANAFAKNQMRLAYEDKRDLYCSCIDIILLIIMLEKYQTGYPSQHQWKCAFSRWPPCPYILSNVYDISTSMPARNILLLSKFMFSVSTIPIKYLSATFIHYLSPKSKLSAF